MNSAQSLRAQQLAFAAAVADGTAAPGLLAADPHGGAPRLGVYQHAYRARLADALRDNFEILARVMGDEAFEALAHAYIAAQPSTQPSIRWFGHRLADFMEALQAEGTEGGEDTAGAEDAIAPLVPHPAFVDFARMDWALRAAFDAADAPALGREALAGRTPQDFAALRFVPHPSLQRVALDWAIEAAWRALRTHLDSRVDGGDGDPDGGEEPELPAPEPQPHTLVAWRRGQRTLWRSADAAEAAMLQGLADGETFAQLCERAAAHSPHDDDGDAATLAASTLARWLDDGLITRLG